MQVLIMNFIMKKCDFFFCLSVFVFLCIFLLVCMKSGPEEFKCFEVRHPFFPCKIETYHFYTNELAATLTSVRKRKQYLLHVYNVLNKAW